MGIRRRNRLVSMNATRRQIPPRRGFPGTRSGKPHARDPPLTEAAQLSSAARGRPPHRWAANEERAMREHHPLSTSDSQS
jgi:hypothetical protein